jgi:hypothetical protein
MWVVVKGVKYRTADDGWTERLDDAAVWHSEDLAREEAARCHARAVFIPRERLRP